MRFLKNNWTKTIFWSAVDKRGEAWVRIKGRQGSHNAGKTGRDQHADTNWQSSKGNTEAIGCRQRNCLVKFYSLVAWADCFPPGLLCPSLKGMHSAVRMSPSAMTAGIVSYLWGWGFFHILSLIWTSAPLSSKYLIQSSHMLPRKAKLHLN